jgi:U3 small nucleolar ribonucleoprotein protein IMP3
MVRKLKHHEQKLLRKVDFTTYKSDNNHRDHAVIRRYNIQKPEDYHKINRICGVCLPFPPFFPPCTANLYSFQSLRQLAHRLSLLPPDNPTRRKHEELLLNKLYDMGVLSSASKLSAVEHGATVSAFARRRLPVVMTRLRMAETVQAATKMIEQGHVRVGTETITDPAYLVTRTTEDFVTWSVGSKIKKNIMKYRDQLDDFELL